MQRLEALISSENLAEAIGEKARQLLAQELLQGFEQDKESMQDYLAKADLSMEVFKLLKKRPKAGPFRNPSNLRFPLLSTAVINFAARAVSETKINGEYVGYRIFGHDPDGFRERLARREKTYINYQLGYSIPNYNANKKASYMQVAVTGNVFFKVYYDPLKKKKMVKLLPHDALIFNAECNSLQDCPRTSEFQYLTPRQVVEYMRAGLFRELDISKMTMDINDPKAVEHELLEIHCWADLDGDGYPEPWVVVMHKASQEILRISPRFAPEDVEIDSITDRIIRINPEQYYVHYKYWDDPEGKILGIGLGTLVSDTNEAVTSLFNQLIDAGSLSNYQGGFIGADLRIRRKRTEVDLGDWISVDSDGMELKEGIFPFNFKEPSQVLLSLVMYLVDSVNKLTSVTEPLTGTANPSDASPNVINQMINQGLKIYNSILKGMAADGVAEIEILKRLNRQYPDIEEYLTIVNPSDQELQEMVTDSGGLLDFTDKHISIVPVLDLSQTTEAERLMQMQDIMISANQIESIKPNTVNMKALWVAKLHNMNYPNPERYVMPDPPPDTPNVELIKLQSELDKNSKELQFKDREIAVKEKTLELDAITRGYELKETIAKTMKLLEEAKVTEAKVLLEKYKLDIDKFNTVLDAKVALKMAGQGASSVESMSAKQDEKLVMKQSVETPKFPDRNYVYNEAMKRGWTKRA